jgi:hypothetical protein
MPPLQPIQVFRGAFAAATLFVVVGILYLDGLVVSSRPQDKGAVVSFVLAMIATSIAYVMRPWAVRA